MNDKKVILAVLFFSFFIYMGYTFVKCYPIYQTTKFFSQSGFKKANNKLVGSFSKLKDKVPFSTVFSGKDNGRILLNNKIPLYYSKFKDNSCTFSLNDENSNMKVMYICTIENDEIKIVRIDLSRNIFERLLINAL